MIRHGLEYVSAYLQRAFADLADEDVCALLVVGSVRSNQAFLEQAAAQLNRGSGPTCAVPDADIYFSRPYAENVRVFLRDSRPYPGSTVVPPGPEAQAQNVPLKISPARAKASFGNISPAPFRGISFIEVRIFA